MKQNLLFNQLTAMPKRLAMVLTVLFTLGVGSMWGQEVLFHETFGDNSNSARNWSDTYSVKSGISEVYADVTYTMTNLKQSKNSVGCTQSGLLQTTKNSDASIVIGPLNVTNYEDLELLFMYKAGSVNGTYKRSAQYKTSSNGTWKDLSVSGTQNASTCYEQEATLPVAAEGIETLYIKIIFNTSNTQATIDEVEITGTKKASCTEPTVAWQTEPANGNVGGTMTAKANTNYPAGLTYSSSDPSVATIDASGVIEYLKAGSTTITAKVTGDGTTYCNKTVSVTKTINVTCGSKVTINTTSDGHGTIIANPTSIETCSDNDGNRQITITLNPNSHYSSNAPTISGITNATITGSGNTYTVQLPKGSNGTLSVSATFKEDAKYTVTWSADGTPIKTQEVYVNEQVSEVLTTSDIPEENRCGDKFVGWTTSEYTGNTAPGTLYPTAADIPAITGDITFYAVFADYAD